VNARQRDLFLYQWSRRRRPGRVRRLLASAVVGGLGGVAFAWALYSAGARTPGVHAYDTAGQIGSLLQLLLLAVPAFAAIALATADRVWRSHEGMYRNLLASGAQVPERKPDLTIGDRGPAIAVATAVVVIAALIWAANTGRL
jgi:hypothetical protein